MLLKTLAPAIPNRVVAQSNDAACSGIFSGEDPDERRVKSLHRKYVQHIDPTPAAMAHDLRSTASTPSGCWSAMLAFIHRTDRTSRAASR